MKRRLSFEILKGEDYISSTLSGQFNEVPIEILVL